MRPLLRYSSLLFFLLISGCSTGVDSEKTPKPPAEQVPPQEDGGDPTALEDDVVEEDAVEEDAVEEDAVEDAEDPWVSVALLIEEERANANIPGLAVAVTRPGEVVWTGAFGLANRETNLLVRVDTPFMLASVSKTVTAVAVMHAAQEDRLSLDEEINAHLPFNVDNPQVDDEVILIRHLVSHTSGIRDNWSQIPYFDGDSPHPLRGYLEGYLIEGGQWYDADQNFFANMPGTANIYGNVATALAGFVLEAATGSSFDDYCDEHVFAPLSMDNTGWHLADFDPAIVAMPYEYVNGRHQAVGHYGYPDYPDGQLRSSVADMSRLLAAISNQGQLGEAVVLSPQSTQEMLTAQFPSVDSTQFVFWHEFISAGRMVIGHGGSDRGVATRMVFSSDSGIGIIILLNTDWDTAGEAPETILEALFAQAEEILRP